jgi:molybdate/tungstate transport system permease protein
VSARLPLRQLLPPAALLVAFLALPIALLVGLTPPAALLETLRDPEVESALAISGLAATLATVVGVALGVPLAYLLARAEFRGKRVLEGLVDLPIVLPHSAAGLAILFVFGRRSLFAAATGVELAQGFLGIVLAMTFVSVPFLVRSARNAFLATDAALEGVARTLGASPWQVFQRISLPLASRGVATGVVLMWARAVSEFGAVLVIAYDPKTAPVLLWKRFELYGIAHAQPLGAVLVVLALAIFVLAQLAATRFPDRGKARV